MNRGENQALGQFIRTRRESRGLTAHQAADRAGVDYSYWTKLENGFYEAPSPITLKGIAAALGVPIEDLYGLVGYDVPERLPNFTPYLRTKYRSLPPAAVADLERYFDLLRNFYGIPANEPVFPNKQTKKASSAKQTTDHQAPPANRKQPGHPWRKDAA